MPGVCGGRVGTRPSSPPLQWCRGIPECNCKGSWVQDTKNLHQGAEICDPHLPCSCHLSQSTSMATKMPPLWCGSAEEAPTSRAPPRPPNLGLFASTL